ncbi:hypothetical protein KC640_00110, partial [Candidatus Dojkabacteria bacterium]|nr:hypothetical protein [Candidatus Dojkabacteria bacterium]
ERTKEVNSSYDLNGGIDSTWRDLASNIDVFPRNIFFDTTQISTPGVFFQNTAKEYELYITPSGFLWREV